MNNSIHTYTALTRLFLVIAVFSLSFSCNKKTDDLTPTELLTRTNWVLYKYYERTGTGPWVEDPLPSYKIDDLFIFRKNGTFEWNEGATKASPSDPQIISSQNWQWSTNPKYLQLTNVLLEVEELTMNSLILIEDDDTRWRLVAQ